jgi:hypothetical protein
LASGNPEILAAQADGEASVSFFARDLSIMVTSKEQRPQAAPRSWSTALFADGLANGPARAAGAFPTPDARG